MIYHVHNWAKTTPDRQALIFEPDGESRTFRQLEADANRAANALRSLGVLAGDCITLCLDNSPALVALTLGAQRIGLYYVLASTKLSSADLNFLVEDSGSRLCVISGYAEAARQSRGGGGFGCSVLGTNWPGFEGVRWEDVFAAAAATLPTDLSPGREMIYTSGTTGRPKGVRKPPFEGLFDQVDSRNASTASAAQLTSDAVYLSTSPLYHAAPNRYLSAALHFGVTSIVMGRFDAGLALRLIAKHHCTHSLWVPTMFHRLLRLPEAERLAHDLSSMRFAAHGAAPCPVHVKEQMIEWWGPVIYEYYSGTEGIGATSITSPEWLLHKGSVGRAKDGILHIVDDQGHEVGPGTIGRVCFESGAKFEYWNDREKTRSIETPQGWRSFGDVGYVDAEGYLYLTDREHFTINSGGVKIYPQEIENMLLSHPAVGDAAVFGLPDEEFGERVVAVVQLAQPDSVDAALEATLKSYCREKLGPIKTPKRVFFQSDFPRHATGKLYKKMLQERYRVQAAPGDPV